MDEVAGFATSSFREQNVFPAQYPGDIRLQQAFATPAAAHGHGAGRLKEWRLHSGSAAQRCCILYTVCVWWRAVLSVLGSQEHSAGISCSAELLQCRTRPTVSSQFSCCFTLQQTSVSKLLKNSELHPSDAPTEEGCVSEAGEVDRKQLMPHWHLQRGVASASCRRWSTVTTCRPHSSLAFAKLKVWKAGHTASSAR